MQFNQLLRAEGVLPEDVTILLHNTRAQPLRRLLASMVFERADVFDAYQSVHSEQAAATLRGRPWAARFVPVDDRRMMYVGLYAVNDLGLRPKQEIYCHPGLIAVAREYGDPVTAEALENAGQGEQAVFDMALSETMAELRGRLQVMAPGGRTYARLAVNLDFEIIAVTEEPLRAAPAPEWEGFIVTAAEMRSLPASWSARLREWRGVYLIVDESDGSRYVGAAYGQENLLGRWKAHVAGDRGVTVELARRNPEQFRFSILELVSPAALPEDVIKLEVKWKERLHSRKFGLNVN